MASGYLGLVNNQDSVKNWTVDDTKTADSTVTSATAGGTLRAGGIRSWSGGFEGSGGLPPVMPGESFLFEGYTTPTTGVEGTDGIIYTGTALVNQVTIVWNFATNTILAWTVAFNGQPGLTFPSGAPVLDVSIPNFAPTCPTKIVVDATEVEIPFVTTITLTISMALVQEANSGTKSGGDCWTMWSPGAIDWTLAVAQEDFDRLGVLTGNADIGAVTPIKIFTDAVDSWQLKFGRQMDYTGLVVDRATNTVISRTQNWAMTSSDSIIAVGNIVVPGNDPEVQGEVYWGIADIP